MIPTGGSVGNQHIEKGQQPSRTYRLDFEQGRVIGMTDGLEAVKQAVYKILNTERFHYLIYDSNYGMDRNRLLSSNPSYIRSELGRRIKEALLQDDRIEDVTDFKIDVVGDTAIVRFNVVSSFGVIQEEVTVNV